MAANVATPETATIARTAGLDAGHGSADGAGPDRAPPVAPALLDTCRACPTFPGFMQRHASFDPLLDQTASVRALVVADDPLVRDGFLARLSDAAVGEAASDRVDDALQRCDPNVLLWDLGPAELATSLPHFDDLSVPVIALSPPGGNALALLAAGAAGVVRRDASGGVLLHAVHSVLDGLLVLEPDLFTPPSPSARSREPVAPGAASLTAREREVLGLMASGLSNKRIAARLGISAHTAKFHIAAILAKLDATTRTEAVVKAVQLGLVLL